MALILGIDDAGRGPIIGPMILAGVLIRQELEKFLKKENVKDSKKLLHEKRIALAPIIIHHALAYHIEKSFPDEIDQALITGTNLNSLEALKTAAIINAINTGEYTKERIKVVVDCPSTNIISWRTTLLQSIKHIDNLEIVCEHKADVNHVAVSAASILAKVAREEEVTKLKKEFERYGDVGSGYPADPITKEFLKAYGEELADSGLFRKSWATWKCLFPQKGQATLTDFQ